jgi:hypothetical protein
VIVIMPELAVNAAVGSEQQSLAYYSNTPARACVDHRVAVQSRIQAPVNTIQHNNSACHPLPLPSCFSPPCSLYNSYLRTMPHADYPSGTSCVCVVWAEFTERFLNRVGSLPYATTFPKVRESSAS